jgi:hypothetical protein
MKKEEERRRSTLLFSRFDWAIDCFLQFIDCSFSNHFLSFHDTEAIAVICNLLPFNRQLTNKVESTNLENRSRTSHPVSSKRSSQHDLMRSFLLHHQDNWEMKTIIAITHLPEINDDEKETKLHQP